MKRYNYTILLPVQEGTRLDAQNKQQKKNQRQRNRNTRLARIKQIKTQIASGSYVVNSQQIAQALLQRPFVSALIPASPTPSIQDTTR